MKDQVSETLPLGHFDAVWLRNCTATLTSHALKVFAAILKAACRTIGSCCKNREDWEKLRRPKVSQSHSMPWCHVLHNEVGGFLIATPAYLDDGHVIPCDLEAVWVEGPRSVPQLDLAGLLPFWDLKATGHLSVFFFLDPSVVCLKIEYPPNPLRINKFIIMFLIDWARAIIGVFFHLC